MNPNFAKKALLIVDMQNDFMTGGSLQVGADGASEKLVPLINGISPKYGTVVTTQDWHPFSHSSFKEQGGMWPAHCVAGTPGAELNKGLARNVDLEIKKGTEAGFEAYSGFSGTELAQKLKDLGIEEVHVCGLATNFCVKATALDAKKSGFETVVLLFACEGVENDALNIHVAPAIQELQEAGIEIVK